MKCLPARAGPFGSMAERLNALVSKTGSRRMWARGFESFYFREWSLLPGTFSLNKTDRNPEKYPSGLREQSWKLSVSFPTREFESHLLRFLRTSIHRRCQNWRKFATTKPAAGDLNNRYHRASSKPNRLRVSVSLRGRVGAQINDGRETETRLWAFVIVALLVQW